ncbi:helix-turn-helix transcriptional regulator [Muricoccus vinaceus]|uniref:Helix-turn-helix transcriptional regulator n=1 Tax=Muricoccus vinaceus TaxID=424704 RepID=A0ABV6INH1_9PROT
MRADIAYTSAIRALTAAPMPAGKYRDARLALSILREHCTQDGLCEIGAPELAEELKVDSARISRILSALEEVGAIRRELTGRRKEIRLPVRA